MTPAQLRRVFILLGVVVAANCAAQRFKPVVDHGVWWIQGLKGERIFSLGCCVVDPGTSWNDYDLSNPSYAGFKFYPNKAAWAADSVKRLEEWNFNTIGAWSSYGDLLAVKSNHLYMTPILHIGSSAGAPWLDMWDPGIVKIMDDVAKTQIRALKNDPRVIGYFSDNEMGWWKAGVFHWIWDQKTHNTRQRTVELLKSIYRDSWERLFKDFQPDGASSFAELENRGRLWMRPGAKGVPAVTQVMSMLAQRYYSLCKAIIRKYDPGALFLGDRYISNYYPEIAAQAGKYCDVVSTNLNPDWPDGGFVRFHLAGLEQLTHKPLMVTEYYMTAMENRTGNKNDSSGFPVVQTQEERARGFRNTTLRFAHCPYLVGCHWFQFYDEPKNGRGDGENYDFGLVDSSNRPYEDLVRTAKELDLSKSHAEAAALPVADALPKSPANVDDMTTWNRDDAFVPAVQKVPRGDMYASWSPNELAVALYWHEDRFEDNFYKNGVIPARDRSTVEIEIPGAGVHWRYRLGPTEESDHNKPLPEGGKIEAGPVWKFKCKAGTSSHLIVQIPSSALGNTPLQSGAQVRFRVKLVSESRAYTTEWEVAKSLR